MPSCIVAMEACAGAHHWGREFISLSHDVRLIAPIYVKPFVKRQKNDAADAEAIVEAALRPTMRFVSIKSVEKQASSMTYKTRDLIVRQRTQSVNGLRGHLTEYGVVAPVGVKNIDRLRQRLEATDCALPEIVVTLCFMLLDHIANLTKRLSSARI